MKDIKKDPFEEYIKNLPPTRKELGQAWQAAIGLQDVDGLKPSEYLYETAKKSIDGEISVDEAGDLINSYYESKDGCSEVETRTEEADKVSARIAKILSEKAFTFSPTQYLSIHRELFLGIYSHAGKIRECTVINLDIRVIHRFGQDHVHIVAGGTLVERIRCVRHEGVRCDGACNASRLRSAHTVAKHGGQQIAPHERIAESVLIFVSHRAAVRDAEYVHAFTSL